MFHEPKQRDGPAAQGGRRATAPNPVPLLYASDQLKVDLGLRWPFWHDEDENDSMVWLLVEEALPGLTPESVVRLFAVDMLHGEACRGGRQRGALTDAILAYSHFSKTFRCPALRGSAPDVLVREARQRVRKTYGPEIPGLERHPWKGLVRAYERRADAIDRLGDPVWIPHGRS